MGLCEAELGLGEGGSRGWKVGRSQHSPISVPGSVSAGVKPCECDQVVMAQWGERRKALDTQVWAPEF